MSSPSTGDERATQTRSPGLAYAANSVNCGVTRRLAKKNPIVLAMDIGSSSTRSALFDSKGAILSKTDAVEHYSIPYGPDGAAELSPVALLRAVSRCVATTLSGKGRTPVTAVSISSFWHGLLGLDVRWQPLTPIFTWADSRAVEAARDLRNNLDESRVHSRTGCRLHTSYWPAKLRWLKTDSPTLFRKVALWVSPADWILHRLFGTRHTTPSMASATGLFNLENKSVGRGNLPRLAAFTKEVP